MILVPRKSLDDRTLVRDLGELVLENAHFARDRAGELYYYDHGVYIGSAEEVVRRKVKDFTMKYGQAGRWNRSLALEVIEYVRLDAPALDDIPPAHTINVSNGLLNIWTGDIEPHSPEFLSPIQIPVSFDPDARCPAVEKFVSETFEPETSQVAWEVLGDLITPDRSIQKAICLLGEGGNGKGVFCELCVRFLGPENVTHLSLQKLERDRFAPARLHGKLANICPDLPVSRLDDSAVFKALTGCDRITGEHKYRNSFEFHPFARLLFSANHLPGSRDATRAYFDRWLIVPFEKRFRNSSAAISRRVLDASLSTSDELSGVLNRALPALRQVRNSGRFTESASMRQARREFQTACDFFGNWLDAEIVTDHRESVGQGELYAAFSLLCARSNRNPITRQMFGRLLKKHRLGIEEFQTTVDGVRHWRYRGICLRNANALHSIPSTVNANGAAWFGSDRIE